MYKFAVAILLLSAPHFARIKVPILPRFAVVRRSARRPKAIDLCAGLQGHNNRLHGRAYKPNMPQTNMKDTVIPKSGDVQSPQTTPTTAAETK